MNLTNLKWTKNVKRDDGKWAYSYIDIDWNSKVFDLHWKADNYENAKKPQEGDLIILRQQAKVTHIVELINNTLYEENSKNSWIHRLVKVTWMAECWNEPPQQNDVFDYQINYRGGKAMKLEELPSFQQHLNVKGGISAFQKHIQTMLNL